jgi:hypothetical protein
MERIFECDLCGGNVVEGNIKDKSYPIRTWRRWNGSFSALSGNIKDKSYPIRTDRNFVVPIDFNSAFCEKCDAIYVTYEEAEALEEMWNDAVKVLGELL